MRHLVAFGMEDVDVAVPDVGACRSLALLDDLGEGGQGGLQVVDRDDLAASAGQMHVAELAAGVAVEDGFLAQFLAQGAQAGFDGGVELADRAVPVGLG